MCCAVISCSSCALQCTAAPCSAAVFGPVHGGHSLPAGDGVLSTGEYPNPQVWGEGLTLCIEENEVKLINI